MGEGGGGGGAAFQAHAVPRWKIQVMRRLIMRSKRRNIM